IPPPPSPCISHCHRLFLFFSSSSSTRIYFLFYSPRQANSRPVTAELSLKQTYVLYTHTHTRTHTERPTAILERFSLATLLSTLPKKLHKNWMASSTLMGEAS